MEKKSLLIFLIPIILIHIAIITPVIELDNGENSFSDVQTAIITPAIELDNGENSFRSIQCDAYYGC